MLRTVPFTLEDFLCESLRIEGIHRDPTLEEVGCTRAMLRTRILTVDDMITLVDVYAPGHRLRDAPGLDVRVGNYVAPAGGPEIRTRLEQILDAARKPGASPWRIHVDYEMLHPFTDGNGRSGRALWLWMHKGYAPLGFLHKFYYETLENSPRRSAA